MIEAAGGGRIGSGEQADNKRQPEGLKKTFRKPMTGIILHDRRCPIENERKFITAIPQKISKRRGKDRFVFKKSINASGAGGNKNQKLIVSVKFLGINMHDCRCCNIPADANLWSLVGDV